MSKKVFKKQRYFGSAYTVNLGGFMHVLHIKGRETEIR